MHLSNQRHLPVPGTFNIRDLGGYAAGPFETRWRRILRADGLHHLDEAGIAVLTDEGVTTVIDLRHGHELESQPNPFHAHPAVAYHNVSLFERLAPGDMAAGDVLLDATLTDARRLDLGHYDCFNHYIGINGAPDLFTVQGTPPDSHEGKHLCRVHADGRLERLWPLLKPDGTPASHAMECRGAYVDDALGAGLVIAGKHYSPTVGNAYRGFIYRKSLARGQERWRHATPASASAIVVADGLVLAAFLDGTLMLIDADSGDLLLASRVRIGGIATVLYALAAHGGRLAVGAIDGRIALVDLAALAALRPTRGGIDLA